MLIDYISPEKLPQVVVWLDWNFFIYGRSLVIFVLLALLHWHVTQPNIAAGWSAFAVGVCCWVVYCAARYGYGVG